jgi:hypothetical protein
MPMSLLAFPARLTAASAVSIVDALLGEVIVRLTATTFTGSSIAESDLSCAESMRQAPIDNAVSNVSACGADDLKFIIPATPNWQANPGV